MDQLKKVVLIGGGTGSAVFLKTLKKFPCEITAIVTVADDGGSSGSIRKDYGILPPGDIRNCIIALADEENIMAELMDVRFTNGFMKTQSFGNIMIAAMNKISGNFPLAVKMVSDILAIRGRVLPVTTSDIRLCAQLTSGKIIKGESKIPILCAKEKDAIDRMFLEPHPVDAYQNCLDAIKEADIIVYSPGSLYTSLIPNLLVNGICEALLHSCAKKYYIQNIMTQNGETDSYTMQDHIHAIEKHSGGKKIIDTVVYSSTEISDEILALYRQEEAYPVVIDSSKYENCYAYLGLDLAMITNQMIRHNSKLFWETIFQ